MAKSKYEYVKSFELEDEIMPPNIIVVRIDGRDFRRLSELHEFEKPYDRKSLELMNACAMSVLEQFKDISFSYGFSDEYSFVFKKGTEFYKRRASKIHSLTVSFFTSVYVAKWKEFFPQKSLRYAPSFRSRVICCASMEVLQAYLLWRQIECHSNNQYDTCFWQLIKSGKTEKEAEEMLKVPSSPAKGGGLGSQKQVKNELLYQSFNINYKKDIPEIFRQGTCVYRTEKFIDNGCHVKRPRNIITVHSKNIASRRFWNEQSCLLEELGQFSEDLNKTKAHYVRSFQYESRLMPFTWIVIRVDGCHFQRFSKDLEFEKPNDVQALNLMNSCAACVLEEFMDIVFAYGDSDEYSFVLKRESQLYGRHASEIVSAVVSLFSSIYTMKWNDFFPRKEMKRPPYFDARAICYPSRRMVWAGPGMRGHINNQYNTCYWMLVKSAISEPYKYLKGTRTQEKNELLDQLSGVSDYYNTLSPMFRHGSSVYWDRVSVSLPPSLLGVLANQADREPLEKKLA
ncbi:tRNA-His guanylyltransferase [Orobanche gracilis]